jgi:hypothetical protein
MKLQRLARPRRVVNVVTPAVVLVVLLGIGSPAGASTSSSAALRIANYAVATATHDNPAHIVTAADVSNAAGINKVNTSSLELFINLGDVFGYSRLVLFFQPKSYADICLNFRDSGVVALVR